jgi:hypothetical protein
MFGKQRQAWAITTCDDPEEITHTAENGYECSDPDCICHDAQEGDQQPLGMFLPSTETALAELRQSRRR